MKQIFIGKSIEEAKGLAIKEFDVDSSRISFEIIEEPKKSMFGKIKGEAKVSASYEETKIDLACMYIKKVLKAMGFEEISLEITNNENGAVITILGGKCEEIIGKRGDTLDSLQYLASLVCNKGDKDYFRISLDTCGYREKRKAQLEDLATKMSSSVIKNGRSSALEPMNPYERRIVHSVVSAIDGVTSRSVGDEPYRKVIIASTVKRPEKKLGFQNNNPRSNDRNNDSFNKRSDPQPKSFDFKTSFEKDYKKPKPEDNLNSGLYSKIEF